MIIDHNHLFYRRRWALAGDARYNGAYYYSKEIVKNIIPKIDTDRSWVTINVPGACTDHAIVFIHNNLESKRYEWLKNFKDLILICGVPETCEKVKSYGTPVYLPLSIDIEYVKTYKAKKTKEAAFVGRSEKKTDQLPEGIDCIEDLPRSELLKAMAQYEKIYAVGRIALEAKALGCEVLPYDPRFPDPGIWVLRDNSEVVLILQQLLDEIDKPVKKGKKKNGR
jgi:hypothetical protein